MWSTCSMLVSGINIWPPTGSGRPPATDSVAPAVVMAIHNSGERKVRGFIVYPHRPKAAERSVYSSDVLELVLTCECCGGASIYHDRLESKLNQSKWVALTTILA